MQNQPWLDGHVAANGRPVRENFAQWFEGSQATGDEGLPQVLFHGTNRVEGIIVFDTLSGEIGSHFGTTSQASQFVDDEDGAIYPVYLSIKNPLRLQDLGSFSGDGDDVFGQLDELGLPEPREKGAKGNDYLRARILDAGYDGVVYLNRREGSHDPFGPDGVDGDDLNCMTDEEVMDTFPDARDSWIAMHPEQIKSAIGNSGLYLRGGLSLADHNEHCMLIFAAQAKDIAEKSMTKSLVFQQTAEKRTSAIKS